MQASQELCRFFSRHGTCKWGAKCRHLHGFAGGEVLGGSAHLAATSALNGAGMHSSTIIPHNPRRGRGVPYSTRSQREPQPGTRDREWIGDKKGLSNIRIMSYNILADSYCRQFKELYHKTPQHLLMWQNRLNLLINEVKSINPDIMAFQEVDHFDALEQELNALGYDGVFLQRTGGKPDGCATFYRRSIYVVADSERIKMCEVEGNLRDNVALLLRLKRLDPQEAVNIPDLLVASTHILFNPGRGDVKLAQVRHILKRAADIGPCHNPCFLVLLGDFNSAPHSGVYDFVLKGSLDIRETDRRRLGGQIEGYNCERFVSDYRAGGVQQLRFSNYFEQNASDGRDMKQLEKQGWNLESLKTALGFDPSTVPSTTKDKDLQTMFTVTHPLGNKMKSAYNQLLGSEPLYTTSHQAYMGCVDFVFFSSAACPHGGARSLFLTPAAGLSCPQPSAMGMPSAKWPSDHISLAIDFKVTGS